MLKSLVAAPRPCGARCPSDGRAVSNPASRTGSEGHRRIGQSGGSGAKARRARMPSWLVQTLVVFAVSRRKGAWGKRRCLGIRHTQGSEVSSRGHLSMHMTACARGAPRPASALRALRFALARANRACERGARHGARAIGAFACMSHGARCRGRSRWEVDRRRPQRKSGACERGAEQILSCMRTRCRS